MFLQLKDRELFLICKELNFSKSSFRILINEEVDSVSLKLAESTDFEEIGIPSLDAHMIVDSVKAKFECPVCKGRRAFNRANHDFAFSRRNMNM